MTALMRFDSVNGHDRYCPTDRGSLGRDDEQDTHHDAVFRATLSAGTTMLIMRPS